MQLILFKEIRKLNLKCLFALLLLSLLFAVNSYLYFAYRSATIEEIVYAFNAPTGKLGFNYISPFLYYFVIPFVSVIGLYFFVLRRIEHRLRKKIFLILLTVITIIFTVNTILRLHLRRAIIYYLSPSSFIENNYVDPNKVKISFPEHKRNLIHIYLESVELTFASKKHGGKVNESIIPEIEKLALEGESFSGKEGVLSGAHSLFGSTWTMGGAFAAETGLPLKIVLKGILHGNAMDTQTHFFPNITALGDILEQNGYNCVVMKNVDMTFAGAENFYREHGNNLVMDYKYSSKNGLIPEGYNVWGGFEDYKLFEIAKKKLLELSKEETPFCLTFYTNDTHFPDGYLSVECPVKYDDQYSNVYACSSAHVSDFINWVRTQPFYENTTIVIHGDHPTMNETYSEERGGSKETSENKVFTTILNSAIQYRSDFPREYSTFDLFPTIISSLGAQIEGDKLGLGSNLYSDKETLLEKSSISKINKELAKRSYFMERLAALDFSKTKYSFDSLGKYISDFVPTLDNKTVIIAVRGEATKGINEQLASQLRSIGLKTNFSNIYGKSYIAIIGDGDVFEESSDDLINKKIKLKKLNIECTSGGIKDNQASIILNNKDYSKNMRGINIVIYDHKAGKVVSSESFDTHISQ